MAIHGLTKSKVRIAGWITLVLILTAGVYSGVIRNDFLRTWDDNRYIIDNPHIVVTDFTGLINLFGIYYDGHYHPLTLLSLATDHMIGGDQPVVYHLTNLLFHLLNTLLVFWFVYLLLSKKNLFVPLVTALFFGLGTMHVESVAWASERKNVLYAFFYLLSVVAYIQYIKRNSALFLAGSIFFFILSLLSKAMALPLCFTLVAIDMYANRELRSKKLWLEKAPFFILAIAFGIVSIMAQKSTWGEDLSQVHYAFWERVLFASWAFVNYAVKLVIPYKLSGFYPYPPEINGPVIARGVLALTVIAALAYWFFRTVRKFSIHHFGVLFFVINIFLLLKLFEVPAGDYIMADRYAYIPSIGIYLMLAALSAHLLKRKGVVGNLVVAGLVLLGGSLAFKTSMRVKVFADDLHFYSNILDHYPQSGVAYTNRGALYREQGRHRLALKDFSAVIALGDAGYREYSNRGNTYVALGDYQKALADLQRAVRMKGDDARVLASYGYALLQTGDFSGSIAVYDQAIQRDSGRPEYFQNRGTARYSSGDLAGAAADYSKAIELDPTNADACFNRGLARIGQGRLPDAITDFQATLSLEPRHAMACSNLGVAYSRSGQMDLAMQSYDRALGIKPDFLDVYLNRGIDYYTLKQYDQALQDLEHAIRLNPAIGASFYFRGLTLLGLGREGACDDFQQALRLGFNMAAEQVSQHCK